jgi:ABC-2 type transport system permease protein
MPLMPDWVQEVARFLPFQWAFYFPIQTLVGDYSGTELLRGLGAQLLWILIGFAIFRVAWRFAIRRYSAVGG